MKRMDFEDCKRIQGESRRLLPFPTLGVEVLVQKLSLDDLAAVQAVTGGADNADTNKEGEVLICALAIINDDGTQPYNTAEGKDALRLLDDVMRKVIANTALGMVGLDGVKLKNS